MPLGVDIDKLQDISSITAVEFTLYITIISAEE